MDASKNVLVGVDVGGSKIGVLIVDPLRRVLSRSCSATDVSSPQRTLAGILAAIYSGMESASIRMSDVAAVGLGIPGRVDPYTGVVRVAVNLNWQEYPVGQLLSKELGVSCFLENDVRAAALGLRVFGEYPPDQNIAYVSVGTGISAGLILEGRLYQGAHGMAGEIGHIVVDPQGPRCLCGAWGCLETFAAGPAIARMGQQAVAAGEKTLLQAFPSITAQTVYQASEDGDPVARSITEKAGTYLGRALYGLVMSYDVDKIVLGGGVTHAGEAFMAPLLNEIERQRQSSSLAREMLVPGLFQLLPPDYDAGMWGGVALAQNGIECASLHRIPSLPDNR